MTYHLISLILGNGLDYQTHHSYIMETVLMKMRSKKNIQMLQKDIIILQLKTYFSIEPLITIMALKFLMGHNLELLQMEMF